jgi:hypothetical protein
MLTSNRLDWSANVPAHKYKFKDGQKAQVEPGAKLSKGIDLHIHILMSIRRGLLSKVSLKSLPGLSNVVGMAQVTSPHLTHGVGGIEDIIDPLKSIVVVVRQRSMRHAVGRD